MPSPSSHSQQQLEHCDYDHRDNDRRQEHLQEDRTSFRGVVPQPSLQPRNRHQLRASPPDLESSSSSESYSTSSSGDFGETGACGVVLGRHVQEEEENEQGGGQQNDGQRVRRSNGTGYSTSNTLSSIRDLVCDRSATNDDIFIEARTAVERQEASRRTNGGGRNNQVRKNIKLGEDEFVPAILANLPLYPFVLRSHNIERNGGGGDC